MILDSLGWALTCTPAPLVVDTFGPSVFSTKVDDKKASAPTDVIPDMISLQLRPNLELYWYFVLGWTAFL